MDLEQHNTENPDKNNKNTNELLPPTSPSGSTASSTSSFKRGREHDEEDDDEIQSLLQKRKPVKNNIASVMKVLGGMAEQLKEADKIDQIDSKIDTFLTEVNTLKTITSEHASKIADIDTKTDKLLNESRVIREKIADLNKLHENGGNLRQMKEEVDATTRQL